MEPPHGVFGGHEGLTGRVTKNPGGSDEESFPSKVTGYKMAAQDLVQIISPSGGGYGDPREREADMVLDDYLDDYITLEIARDTYGVAIDSESDTVIEAETRRLRGG